MLSFIKKIIPYFFALIISFGIITFYHIYRVEGMEPKEVYRVYLDGKVIGNIKSKKAYEEYINKEQEEIKKKYGVTKVYAPSGVDIQKAITYNNKILSIKKIDSIIRSKKPFTIKSYKVTIKKQNDDGTVQEPIYINVLSKEMFENSINNIVESFIGEEKYEKYKNNTQEKIESTGTIIKNLYLNDNITIKETLIPTNEEIFINEDELTKYLLFGEIKENKYYTVKAGDMLEQITYNNKMSIEEFLIINPEFNNANVILSEGQQVRVGTMQPILSLVVKKDRTSDEEVNYETKYEYDGNLTAGTRKVKTEGQKGLVRINSEVIEINNEVKAVKFVSSEVIKETVDKTIVVGTYYPGGGWSDDPNSYGSGDWSWPTIRPYMITSRFAWRWGKFHNAVDIAGCGYGSPIYAANNGVVAAAYTVSTTNEWSYGSYIIINHQNGYYTLYAHLSGINVSSGTVIKKGQKIGAMGHSGRATGTHLHFGVYKGYPNRGGVAINPLSLY